MTFAVSGIAAAALLVGRRAFDWAVNPSPAARPISAYERVAVGVGGGFMSLAANLAVPMPQSKGDAQKMLRAFGHTGLKIDSIAADRIYALTAPQLQQDGQMKRRALTIMLTHDEIEMTQVVRADSVDGWVVE